MDAAVRRVRAAGLTEQVDGALPAVQAELDVLVGRARSRAARQGAAVEQLWTDLAGCLGGALVRPRLLLACYLGLGGRDAAPVAPVAAAVELLHTAMLVHDDLLDHDEVRRGRPNLAGATRARLTAAGADPGAVDDQVVAASVLAGDVGIAATFALVAAAPVGAATRVGLVGLVADAITTTVAGELLDVAAELAAPDRVDPLLIAELKTAAYSTRLPLVAGALLAGADAAAVAALERVGLALGVAYQLVDDLQGVFGDPARTGKSDVSDLRDGKRTLLLAAALERADQEQRSVLVHHVGDRDLDELGAARVRAVLRATGALTAVRRQVDDLLAEVSRCAHEELPPPLADWLDELAGEIAARGA